LTTYNELLAKIANYFTLTPSPPPHLKLPRRSRSVFNRNCSSLATI